MKEYKPIRINVPAEIDPFDITRSMGSEETMDFICAVDLSMADAGFTEELVIRLINSLKGDLVGFEKEQLINKIHNILKL